MDNNPKQCNSVIRTVIAGFCAMRAIRHCDVLLSLWNEMKARAYIEVLLNLPQQRFAQSRVGGPWFWTTVPCSNWYCSSSQTNV